jgi:RNA polymerase sigma factor (sigma-70 family)
MAKVLLALPGEKREIALKPWLYRIAHNEAIEILRHRRPHAELREATHLAGPALEEHSEQRRRLDELVRDISTLPERQRGALLMRELSGLSYGEIAQAFGTTPAVAKQSVYEARIGLRDQAEGREMDCATVQSAISARDGRVLRGRRIRSHLRSCTICRAFDESIAGRRRDLAAVVPAMPAAAATSVLHGLIGGAGHGAGGGGGLLATLGGGAGETFAGSAAFKAAALAAVTVGAGAGALEGIPAITGDHGGVPPAGVAPALQPASLPAGPGGAAATATWHSSGVSTAQSRSRSGDAASGAIHPQHSPSAAPPAEPASAPQSAATTPGHEQAANAPAQSHAHPSPPGQAGGPAAGSHATPQPALIPPAHEHPAHPLGPTIPTLPETGQPVQGSATPAPPSPASGSGDKP